MTTPTQGEHAQPEALRLAAELRDGNCGIRSCLEPSANELERLHYENKGLRAQVAALTAAPQGGAYAELPTPHGKNAGEPFHYTADQMRAFADRTHALRASHGQAPAATVIKKGADRQWMSERLGHLPDGIYSLYLAAPAQPAEGAAGVVPERIAATWLTDPTPTPERQFCEWLNSKRGCNVSEVFHEIMQRFASHGQAPAGATVVAKPKVVLELPDGDTRTAKVCWSEMQGDTLHLCISVDTATAQEAPAAGPSDSEDSDADR